MLITSLWAGITEALEGWPDDLLTLSLFCAALCLIWLALNGSAATKAIALAYVIFP